MMSVKSIRALKLLMPIVSMITIGVHFIAIATNDWLHTVESMPNPAYEKFSMPAEMEFLKKFTTSGLWKLCYNDPPDTRFNCVEIDYLSQEEYIPDQNDSTMAIPYSMRKAAIYFMLSTGLLILGQTIYCMSQICRSRRIYIFISSIPFILSGLFILTGIVVYISTFKNEVGYKLRPISQFHDALFDYHYGYSFLFLVASLLLCELTGTLSIFLYVQQKHFKIMIDTERDEVLKHNIINILKNRQQQNKDDNSCMGIGVYHHHQQQQHQQQRPRFRITSEDYGQQSSLATAEIDKSSGLQPQPNHNNNSGNNSPINQNFLTADFGIDSAFYHCGRHGSRGRRNSRSNDSYLGSPRETVDLKAHKCLPDKIADNSEFRLKKASIEDGGEQLQELCASGLLNLMAIKESDKNSKLALVAKVEEELLTVNSFEPPMHFLWEKQSNSKQPFLTNQSTKPQHHQDSNKSTFV